jgi:hypothetical protein
VVVDQHLWLLIFNVSTAMPRQADRIRKRFKVHYDDDRVQNNTHRDITITRSRSGRVLSSTSKPQAQTSDSTDPWKGFFDLKAEAFVVDSLPDELQDFSPPALPLDSDEEIKNLPKVRTVVHILIVY